ncbi:cytochrome P450 [Nocardia brasiliensis]|uniref:cytochrome P450 n=1 Tax=Nocardia brasiliensis TaxID=37326 RepID=UPI0024577E0C|nr:cytochrome P450 [Nocardia brasiliensis]
MTANASITNSIPAAPGALPLIGHLVPLLRDPLAFLTSLPVHGALVRVRVGRFTAIVVCDPGLTRQVLRDDEIYDKNGPLIERWRETTGDGLGTCPHRQHRRQRRLVQPVFRSARMTGYARTMTEQAAAITDSWHNGQVLDVTSEMMVMTARVILATLFSDSLPPGPLRQAVNDVATVVAGITRRMLTPPPLDRLPTRGNREYHQARIRLRSTIDGIIAERRTDVDDHGDLLSALVTARDTETDGRGLSDIEIADQVITFFIAGVETTANVLSWALHLLAHHPDIRHRLHSQVDTVLGGRPATYVDLPRLELATHIITETLRLWPPAWMITRVLTLDTELGGYTIPAGTTIVYSPYLLHHRPDLHPNPDVFDPSRYDSRQLPRETFIPFGGGARKCVGDKFAMILAPLTLASITAKWELKPAPGIKVRPSRGALMAPHGLYMRTAVRIPIESIE